MTTTGPSQTLPRDSRLIALLLSQYTDEADKASIAMLTEFAHRYTREILTESKVYAEHAVADKERKRDGVTSVSMRDIRLAITAKTEQNFSSPWPKEFLLPLAATLNKEPLPALQETYGVRLPPESERLTAVNFDLVPRQRPARRARDSNQRYAMGNGADDMTIDGDGEADDNNDALFDDDEDEQDVLSASLTNGNGRSTSNRSTSKRQRDMDEDDGF